MLKIVIKSTLILSLLVFVFASHAHAATIIISPGESIQDKCLDVVNPGDICKLSSGTYVIKKPLELKKSGKPLSPITLTCEKTLTCTIDSGGFNTIMTTGQINHYTIDGLRLISTKGGDDNASSITFDSGKWVSITDKNAGVSNHIVRNSYIEGAIYFYGHHNLVENTELNGKGIWSSGIIEKFGPSHDNIYSNNIIHDYKGRGIWIMQHTDNTKVIGNKIYNTDLMGVDCDGAGNRVDNCDVLNNEFYNLKGVAILLENAFDSLVEGNIIRDSYSGISAINYGKTGNYDPDFHADSEYRHLDIKTVINNNTLTNLENDGIRCDSVTGLTITNNTLSKINTAKKGYYGAIALARNGDFYCRNTTIRGNILSELEYAYWISYGTYAIPAGTYESLAVDIPAGLGNLVIENNKYDFNNTAEKYHYQVFSSKPKSPNEYSRSFTQMKSDGYESGSITSYTPSSSPSPKLVVGDATGEGDVNLFDFSVIVNNYNKSTTNGFVDADFNLDQKVDGQDYVLWLNAYNP